MKPRLIPLCFLALFSLFVWDCGPVAMAGQAARSLPVLELFTSQGCSSCPPADALMHEYADRPDIVALTMPVDYWDYLGWKDTLANPGFTARQRGYAKARGDNDVYTPQTVVNGMVHVVGSHKPEIDRALAHTKERLADRSIPVEIHPQSGGLAVEIGAGPPPNSGSTGTVWIAVVEPRVEVEIGRGENKGRKITYFNVVRDLVPVGSWDGQPATIKLDDPRFRQQPKRRYAVVLQQGTTGPIVGAAWMTGVGY